jgi:hypothetical protein
MGRGHVDVYRLSSRTADTPQMRQSLGNVLLNASSPCADADWKSQ